MEQEKRLHNLNKYVKNMVEVKLRISAIRSILENKTTTGYLATDYEFVCLQFRKVLELIAFSNLVCNEDIYSDLYQNMEKHWRVKDILDKIEKINPNFYPQPVTSVPTDGIDEMVPLVNGFLTRNEFSEVYERCSKHIHITNPFRPEPEIEILETTFYMWLSKIITLLNAHTIRLVDETMFYYISMGNEAPNSVSGNIFRLVNPL
jgi:hypothetical protein